jgi:hypothetical protein
MMTEATGENRQSGLALLAGVHRRQAWRPSGLRGVASILSSIARRNQALDRRSALLTAWYEQFAQRSQPFIGWQPVTIGDLQVDSTQSSFSTTPSMERMSRTESRMISKDPGELNVVRHVPQEESPAAQAHGFAVEPHAPEKPFIVRRPISAPIQTAAKSVPPSKAGPADISGESKGPIETTSQPVTRPGDEASSHRVVSPAIAEDSRLVVHFGATVAHDWERVSALADRPQPPGEQALVRPALRLAILRPIDTATSTARQGGWAPNYSDTSSSSKSELNHLPRLEQWPIAEQPDFRPRLLTSVSSLPRQEVRGGFPANLKIEIGPAADTSASEPFRPLAADPSPLRNPLTPEMPSFARSGQLEIPEAPAPDAPAASAPLALPGLHIRLLRPDESPLATQRVTSDSTGRAGSTGEAPKAPAPSATPPPLDINAVADKVYQVLQRRHQFERERSGLY